MQTPMTQQGVTKEQAVAIAELIKEQLEAVYAELLTMRKPDARVMEGLREPTQARRSARRLRSGEYRPKWLTGTPEELAREYDYAAEYCDKIAGVRRLARTHKQVQLHLANETFAGVRGIFQQSNACMRVPNTEDMMD